MGVFDGQKTQTQIFNGYCLKVTDL